MAYENLLLKVADGIATITVNRPQAMNVLTYATLDELEHAFLAARDDQTVRAVILTGAGERPSSPGWTSANSTRPWNREVTPARIGLQGGAND